jgi:hypothetical protein
MASATAGLDHFWKVQVSQFWRAPKGTLLGRCSRTQNVPDGMHSDFAILSASIPSNSKTGLRGLLGYTTSEATPDSPPVPGLLNTETEKVFD